MSNQSLLAIQEGEGKTEGSLKEVEISIPVSFPAMVTSSWREAVSLSWQKELAVSVAVSWVNEAT